MFSTIALIAATVAATPTAASLPSGPFDALTATYSFKTGDYCIRSGWRSMTAETHRAVRAGDCRNAAEWRQRGLLFAPVSRADAIANSASVAAR